MMDLYNMMTWPDIEGIRMASMPLMSGWSRVRADSTRLRPVAQSTPPKPKISSIPLDHPLLCFKTTPSIPSLHCISHRTALAYPPSQWDLNPHYTRGFPRLQHQHQQGWLAAAAAVTLRNQNQPNTPRLLRLTPAFSRIGHSFPFPFPSFSRSDK